MSQLLTSTDVQIENAKRQAEADNALEFTVYRQGGYIIVGYDEGFEWIATTTEECSENLWDKRSDAQKAAINFLTR